jgi:biotin operon repressor
MMIVLEKKNPTQTDIANLIGISSASVNWQIKRLVELGLMIEVKDGKFKRYSLKIEPNHMVSLMKNYHPNLWSNWSNRLAETFLALSNEGEKQ